MVHKYHKSLQFMQEFRNIYSIVTSWQPTDVEKENLQDMVSKLIFLPFGSLIRNIHIYLYPGQEMGGYIP